LKKGSIFTKNVQQINQKVGAIFVFLCYLLLLGGFLSGLGGLSSLGDF